MFLNIVSLLFAILIVLGFVRVIKYFWSWLADGKAAPKVSVDEYLDTLHIGWYQIIFLFVVGSIAGLFLEEVWMLVSAGITQSRVGLVWGPFSPLYGFGAVSLTLIAFYLRKKQAKTWQIFLISALVGGLLEQITGWGMEVLFKAQSWTYLYLPDHITQWVAWRFLFMWGMLGLMWTRFVMPNVLYIIGKPTTKKQVIFVVILAIYLALDIFMTLACFTRRTQRDQGIPPRTQFEQWIDTHYTDQFMANKFQNLVIGQDL